MLYTNIKEDNMMNTNELYQLYEEYCTDCYYEGTTPKSFEQWQYEGE